MPQGQVPAHRLTRRDGPFFKLLPSQMYDDLVSLSLLTLRSWKLNITNASLTATSINRLHKHHTTIAFGCRLKIGARNCSQCCWRMYSSPPFVLLHLYEKLLMRLRILTFPDSLLCWLRARHHPTYHNGRQLSYELWT